MSGKDTARRAGAAQNPAGESLDPAAIDVPLRHGRRIVISNREDGEQIEIKESGGLVSMSIHLRGQEAVISLTGARLELDASEKISLRADKIELNAREQATIESAGALQIRAEEDLQVDSRKDVRVQGKIIYLN